MPRVWEKTPAEIQITAIFLMQDNNNNALLLFFLPHLKRLVWRRHAARKPVAPSLAHKRGKLNKNYNSTFSNTIHIMRSLYEIIHISTADVDESEE